MRVDLHVHTIHSKDAMARPKELLRWMARRKLDMIAVTDHNDIRGAFEAAELAPESIIIGEEILTREGEIIGLFLNKLISPGLSPRETVERIRQQGGLVYVPHPADRLRGSTLTPRAFAEILPQVDLIEGYNARVLWEQMNHQAMDLAREHNLPVGAGSDAHRAADLGLAYVELPAFYDVQSFLQSLSEGRINGRIVGPVGRLSSLYARLIKRLGR